MLAAASAVITLWNWSALADVKMPAIFGDHMVLQQELALPVWGTAEPGEAVTVTLDGHSARATAGADGKWAVKLPRMKPNAEGVTMTVAGKNTVTISDVLIGEVWVCSGQSNMEFGLAGAHNAKTELPKADDPQLRLFKVAKKTAHTPEPDVTGNWERCTPATAASFTAVGYFFGREMREHLKQPFGLIETSWGGTPAQAWTSLEGLKQDPELAHYVTRWNEIDSNLAKATTDYPAAQAAYQAAMKDWNAKYGKDFAAAQAKWQADAKQAAQANQPPPPRPTPPVPMPLKPVDPSGGQGAPAALYNGMVAPLEALRDSRGHLVPGESNSGRPRSIGRFSPV